MAADSLILAVALSSLAGAMIPVGASLAAIERIQPQWLEQELRHSVVAFGGGALFSAVALVLVPEGIERVPALAALLAFGLGGLVFFWIDRALQGRVGGGAQTLAMLLDFLPEAMALGAMLVTDAPTALLLAALIGLQNLPEGFNAFREIRAATTMSPRRIIVLFAAVATAGPLAAVVGEQVMVGLPTVLGLVMLFAGGGILYLTFGDIAPQAQLDRHYAPPLGAVAGFLLGLAGHLAVAG